MFQRSQQKNESDNFVLRLLLLGWKLKWILKWTMQKMTECIFFIVCFWEKKIASTVHPKWVLVSYANTLPQNVDGNNNKLDGLTDWNKFNACYMMYALQYTCTMYAVSCISYALPLFWTHAKQVIINITVAIYLFDFDWKWFFFISSVHVLWALFWLTPLTEIHLVCRLHTHAHDALLHKRTFMITFGVIIINTIAYVKRVFEWISYELVGLVTSRNFREIAWAFPSSPLFNRLVLAWPGLAWIV